LTGSRRSGFTRSRFQPSLKRFPECHPCGVIDLRPQRAYEPLGARQLATACRRRMKVRAAARSLLLGKASVWREPQADERALAVALSAADTGSNRLVLSHPTQS